MYGQVPRCTRAMLPGTKPAKSSVSQPLVDVFGAGPGGSTRSIPWTAAVTSPVPVNDTKSPSNAGRVPATKTCGSGRDLLEHRGRALDELDDVCELVERHLVTGGLGPSDDVRDRGVVARRAGRPVAAVGVGDLLERQLVLADPATVTALRNPWLSLIGRAEADVAPNVNDSATIPTTNPPRAAWRLRIVPS